MSKEEKVPEAGFETALYMIKRANRKPTTAKGRATPIRARPVFNSKKEKATDRRISVCIDCRRGIFDFHDYLWTSRGLVHTACNDKVQSETKLTT